jgi:hypothetical protein
MSGRPEIAFGADFRAKGNMWASFRVREQPPSRTPLLNKKTPAFSAGVSVSTGVGEVNYFQKA